MKLYSMYPQMQLRENTSSLFVYLHSFIVILCHSHRTVELLKVDPHVFACVPLGFCIEQNLGFQCYNLLLMNAIVSKPIQPILQCEMT